MRHPEHHLGILTPADSPPDPSFHRYKLDRIQANEPRDFAILKLFFHELYKKQSIRIYDLPYEVKQQQIKTFMEKYGVNDASELPSEVGTYYYCPNCASIKTYVTRPKHQKALNTLSLCSLNISYNAYNHKRFCQKTPLLIGYENEDDYDFGEFTTTNDLIKKV